MRPDEETEDVPVYVQLPDSLNAWQLARLAVHSDSRIREGVARHSTSNRQTLLFLSGDHNGHVRQAVAESELAPFQALMWLAKDNIPQVREAVAGNARTPSDALDMLARDTNFHVLKRVARHPATRLPSLFLLAQRAVNPTAFLGREEVPLVLLREIIKYADDRGLAAIARDRRTPLEDILGFKDRLDLKTFHSINRRHGGLLLELDETSAPNETSKDPPSIHDSTNA